MKKKNREKNGALMSASLGKLAIFDFQEVTG